MRFATAVLTACLLASPALAGGAAPGAAASGSAATAPAAQPLDINSASKAELDALPGIGAARSEAIIKGRPYRGKDDLVSRNIVPQGVYDGIKDRIVARQ